ncbi:auxilin-related protein 1-like [Vitis vinifera]|uniref:Auxilin-related protein 1 n=1 Tax=Vitis vinifera TaxID=29760 RepID=F6HJN3_VITVI|nr:auxilin-related protein 1-like [Vitis vinifera]
MSLLVYDKPVYDYDIFDGVPGLNTSGSVNYDVFSTVSGSKQKQNDAFDDLFGGFGRKDPEPKRSGNVEDVGSGFDDLLHGFGRISPPSNRPTTDVNWAPKSTVNATKTTSNVIEDPFVVLQPLLFHPRRCLVIH